MAVLGDIVAMLLRNKKTPWLPNKSIGLNILAIVSGTAFLAFALAVYDGYKSKVERIIFTLTPHVMVRPSMPIDSGSSETPDDETAECLKICGAPNAVHFTEKSRKFEGPERFTAADLAAITEWLRKPENSGIDASKVLFEEEKLVVRLGNFSTEGPRDIRLMGLASIQGRTPAPRIDLAFTDDETAGRFNADAGLLISDVLANEIEQANGTKIVPGQTKIVFTRDSDGAELSYAIAGIHRLGIHAISRNLIIAPYEPAAQLLGKSEQAGPSYVGLTLPEPANAKSLAQQIRGDIRSTELAAVAWQSVSDLFDQLELYRSIIYITLGLSILITAINTFVNINILIRERAQHIGIIRAMGLRPSLLLLSLLLVGFAQALIGTVIGYSLGIFGGYALDDYINSLVRDFIPITDARISPDPIVFFALLAFVTLVSSLTCVLAGRWTLREDIIENLRST
jgi:ABC-type lipoprotein release transport system permease subunit